MVSILKRRHLVQLDKVNKIKYKGAACLTPKTITKTDVFEFVAHPKS